MKKNVSLTGEAISKVRELAREAINPITIRNLLICMGLSTSIIFSSAGGLATREMFTNEVEAATQIESFTDYGSIKDYAKEYIEYLVGIGGIKGYTDGSFKPTGNVTRLEFLSSCINSCIDSESELDAIVEQAKNDMVPLDDGTMISRYDDIVSTYTNEVLYQWGEQSLRLIVASDYLGFDTGAYPSKSGTNTWSAPILRDEAANIMVEVYEYFCSEEVQAMDRTNSITTGNHSSTSTIPINENILSIEPNDGWGSYYDATQKLYSIGVLQGDEKGNYNPDSNLSRADCCVMVAKLMNENYREDPNIAPKVVEEVTVENTTLYQSDADRRSAVEGDTFIDSNGTSYTVTAGIGGVLCAEMPVALDAGRLAVNIANTVDSTALVENGTTVYGSDMIYIINPDTGEGHWLKDWCKVIEAYAASVENPEKGKVYTFGLGDWLQLEFDALGAIVTTPDWLPY